MKKQELHPRTEIINKKQKNQAKIARNEALIWLSSQFPRAFDNSTMIQPLKHGIMNDILAYSDKALAAGISKSKLREAVVIFTRRIDYLTCLKAREMRIDLEGHPITAVTEEEALRAALKIKKHVEKSIKNSRKELTRKPQEPTHGRIEPPSQGSNHPIDAYSSDHTLGLTQPHNTLPRPASVMIKHKSTRPYDPEAVARMKEKLGLSRKNEPLKETTE